MGLEVFFSSEKIQHTEGSKVQLPTVPHGSLRKLCPVQAYKKYQQLKEPLQPRASAPWLTDDKGIPITLRTLTASIDFATTKAFRNPRHKHIFDRLHGHSFRPALATHMQQMGHVLTETEQKLIGRWESTTAFQRYRKDKSTARFTITKAITNQLNN